MPMEPSVLVLKDYGRVRLMLKERMDERNISRNALAHRVDTRFEVINKWYNGEVERIDLDVLARICYVLDCSIPDLLVYDVSAVGAADNE